MKLGEVVTRIIASECWRQKSDPKTHGLNTMAPVEGEEPQDLPRDFAPRATFKAAPLASFPLICNCQWKETKTLFWRRELLPLRRQLGGQNLKQKGQRVNKQVCPGAFQPDPHPSALQLTVISHETSPCESELFPLNILSACHLLLLVQNYF